MTSKSSSSKYENTKNQESRYLTSEKKRYYLASVDGDEQTLINQQKEELTNILIELKSEYDKLSRESKWKTQEINELEKKSKMLEEMDARNQKKFKEISEENEVMKEAIDLKKRKKKKNFTKKKLYKSKLKILNKIFF